MPREKEFEFTLSSSERLRSRRCRSRGTPGGGLGRAQKHLRDVEKHGHVLGRCTHAHVAEPDAQAPRIADGDPAVRRNHPAPSAASNRGPEHLDATDVDEAQIGSDDRVETPVGRGRDPHPVRCSRVKNELCGGGFSALSLALTGGGTAANDARGSAKTRQSGR